MGKKSLSKSGPKQPLRKSRKEMRKEQRKVKKLKRSVKQFRKSGPADSVLTAGHASSNHEKESSLKKQSSPINIDLVRKDEQKKQDTLKSQMVKSRKRQLIAANEDEDRNIRQLEKLLHLNRRRGSKAKSLPKSFSEDGLGYLLEVCDPDMIKDSVKMDQALQDSGSEFEEDFAVVRGTSKTTSKKPCEKAKSTKDSDSDSDGEDGSDFGLEVDDGSNEDMSSVGEEQTSFDSDDEIISDNEEQYSHTSDEISHSNDSEASMDIDENREDESDTDSISHLDDMSEEKESKSHSIPGMKANAVGGTKKKEKNIKHKPNQRSNSNDHYDVNGDFDRNISEEDRFSDCENDSETLNSKSKAEKTSDGTWEDIYGRMRGKDGNVIDTKPGKYIPPALRAKMEGNEDTKRKENLARLHKQMKGLINRLAENNMAGICSQIEELFMKNSRHDMNETLLNLILNALVSHVLTPERLVMEHMLLIAVLHANVGTEVGAHFLQHMTKKFNDMLGSIPEVDNKELDNVLLILSHLYNFKVFTASLMYEVLDEISETLNEKRIELILIVLRSVGFSLRKDDPLALKNLILKLQGKALNCPSASSTNSRVKFMLDILMAIKNNNMSKIPSYSPEPVEHLKKVLRTLVRRGNYVTELKITLDDILKVEERGRWWIVGSAWTGQLPGENPSQSKSLLSSDPTKRGKSSDTGYSAELLELARKQRMNTGVRKDIFCILMTGEDFMDAFEQLLHLNLKAQQRQEIVHIIFDCCLQEKTFNPYYAHLAQKFCDFDRQYQMKFQYCLWDKLKDLDKLHSAQLSNLAKFLAHLFLEKGLPLSALKVISFAEMDKPCVRLIRQIILIILLSEDQTECEAVFQRIALSPQLHLFREGLRLFINHFVLRKGSQKSLPEREFALLQDRARLADKALSSADARMEF